ncbi:MAG TPA: ABC transporter permease [Vicinamibacteria bacterium]|nr:ABC transporter permease [Vicinamibacteria bacterium]
MTSLLYEARQTIRAMGKQPFFTAVAVVTLGLGIGANTAIFSVVDTVLLDRVPYPVEEPENVMVLTEKSRSWDAMSVAYPNFKDWQRLNRSFESMVGFRDTRFNLVGLDEPLRLSVTRISHGYFEIFGVAPALGRLFDESEDEPGAPAVLVLNHELWRDRFGEDPQVVGRVVQLDEAPYTIVGVLPDDFEVSSRERAFTTLEPWAAVNDSAQDRGNHQGIYVLARTLQGVSFEEARSEMEIIASQLEEEYPNTNSGVGITMKRLSERRVEDYRTTLWTLLGAVSLVLLIACANVANLLLARAVSRKRVTAIQAALGASRVRLVRQGLVDGLLLAVAGGALGACLAFGGLHLMKGLLPADLPRIDRIGLDVQVLAYTLGLSGLTGLLFGSFPAWFSSRARPSDPLKEGSRDTGGGAAGRGLLVAEVALATMLLVGASLLIRSVYELTRVDPGFRADHLLTMNVGVPYSRYDGETRISFLRQMDEELRSLPGVRSATVGLVLPMMGSSWSSVFVVDDRPAPERSELPSSLFTPVASGYFETFEIPLIRGRLIEPTDDADSPEVIVINETLASRLWPGQDPIGKRLKQGWPESTGPFNPWREIVGVVGDVKQFGLGEEVRMQTYIPLGQTGSGMWDVQIALRTHTDPLTLVETVKRGLAQMDPTLPVYDVETMEAAISDSVAPRRFTMMLLGLFAALALVLAAVGLYGVIAYSVARRTREIGLRMSVGADRANVFRLVVRQGLGWSSLGALIGVASAAGASQLLSSSLFSVSARDPLTFLIVPVVLLVVAFAASAVPALGASRIDPIRALRYE